VAASFNRLVKSNASIWVVIGAIVVVAIIAAGMTLAHFQRQKEQAIELLVEKGATLIRSFEAGLRISANMENSAFGLQKLLMETAQQPDIDYIIVTNGAGGIVADSDPSSLGDEYGLDLDINQIASSRKIQWRQVANQGGAGTFEVYRGFFPQERFAETKILPKINSEASTKNSMIIYVGFNMEAIEKAGKEDTRNTIIIALILLLIGSSAMISLFLAQAYRLARTSLSRITVFSEALVKNMPVGLIAQDESGRIATCNEKAGAILNIDCSAALGQQADSIVPAPLRTILYELSQKDSLVEKYVQLIFEKDEQKTLEIVAAAISDKGRPAGRIMLLRDVTTIRQLENEVAKSRHLTSIGSLAAGVAHEIRNPLSSIKGFAVYFKERLAGNIEDQKTADIMIQEVERLNRVISQLIEFARPLELKLEKVRFADLVSHTIALVIADAQKNQVSIVVAETPDLPAVEGDPDKIKQVLLNIFLNSLAAMKSVGKLSVNFSTDKDYLDVIIADTGSGIDQTDLPRIYDPYLTSKPAGTGLGLAVVQKIMEAHGGAINVESAIGKGTKVTLQFPFSVTNKAMKG
jgi:two-component system, NtrC family, sensor histidine kinase HydH